MHKTSLESKALLRMIEHAWYVVLEVIKNTVTRKTLHTSRSKSRNHLNILHYSYLSNKKRKLLFFEELNGSPLIKDDMVTITCTFL